jgi:hypothetical protein
MQNVIIHQDNIGKTITVDGKETEISYISKNGAFVRVKSEEGTSIIHDYSLSNITGGRLKVSFTNGETWVEISLNAV